MTYAEVASSSSDPEPGTRSVNPMGVPASAESHFITECTLVNFCRNRLEMEITERESSQPSGRKENIALSSLDSPNVEFVTLPISQEGSAR